MARISDWIMSLSRCETLIAARIEKAVRFAALTGGGAGMSVRSVILSGLSYCNIPSSFKPQRRWLRSITRITYLCQIIGIHALAAFLHLEIYWVQVVG